MTGSLRKSRGTVLGVWRSVENLMKKVWTWPMKSVLVGLMILGKSLHGWNVAPHVSGYFLSLFHAHWELCVAHRRVRQLKSRPSPALSGEIFQCRFFKCSACNKACISFLFQMKSASFWFIELLETQCNMFRKPFEPFEGGLWRLSPLPPPAGAGNQVLPNANELRLHKAKSQSAECCRVSGGMPSTDDIWGYEKLQKTIVTYLKCAISEILICTDFCQKARLPFLPFCGGFRSPWELSRAPFSLLVCVLFWNRKASLGYICHSWSEILLIVWTMALCLPRKIEACPFKATAGPQRVNGAGSKGVRQPLK